MNQTAKLPEQTAQTTVTRRMVSCSAWDPDSCSLSRRDSSTELAYPPLADEGTEGEAAEGTESAEAMEKGSRAVSNPRPQALGLCR